MTNSPPAPGPPQPVHTLLKSLGLDRPELRAWAMYDWANSAMVTTIITAVFPIYFADVAAAGVFAKPEQATQVHANATTLAMVISAVLAPILGAVADNRPVKKALLGMFMAIGGVAVAGMYFIHTGDWVLAVVLFVVANIGANGSFVFYDSLLPHIAHDDEVDRVSTAGYALGYVGGGLALLLNLAWIMKPGWFGLPSGEGLSESQKTLPVRLAFLSVAVWWVVFSIPLFRRVAEPRTSGLASAAGANVWVAAFVRLGQTFRELRRYKQALLMLVAFLIYNDGIGTIFRMATIYGKEINIETNVMIASIVIVQFVGIPFTFLFGALAGKFGAKRSILFTLVVYTGICVLGRFMSSSSHFVALAVLVGMVQGGSQALSRSLFATMIPRDKTGEFFGFFAVVEKFAGIFGPLVFSASISLFGSSRNSVLTLILFFMVGGVLLAMVDVEAGQREARAEETP